jgi:hypothetical protein
LELEQFFVYNIVTPLTQEKRAIIETQIDDNAAAFGQNVTRSWHDGEEGEFLRILVEPAVVEIVFLNERVEVYGAAPTWARVLFTAERKKQLTERIERVLLDAGFVTPETLEAQRQPKRKLFARARERNSMP